VARDRAGAKAATASDNAGHRQRLRERLLRGGTEPLADYELLEFLLFSANARKDMKPVAKRLIAEFGSLARVLAADPVALGNIEGVGDATVGHLKAVEAAGQRLARAEVAGGTIIDAWDKAITYMRSRIGRSEIEQLMVLYLDAANRLIADRIEQRGTVNQAPAYPREIVKRALEIQATAIILVHNHPSGNPKPSRADIDLTNEIAQAAKALGITLHDHIVVSGGAHASFKAMGLLR
jgi:DNA repair protein RadC